MVPGSHSLARLARPWKTRHGHISEVEIPVSLVVRYEADMFHGGIDNAWRDDIAGVVVKEHIVFAGASLWGL